MDFLSALALILLTLVGYSSGIALAGGNREMKPVFMDLVFVAVLWVVAFQSRDALGKWGAILVWLIMGLLIAMALTRIRLRSDTAVMIPESELPEHAQDTENTAVTGNIFVRMWENWKLFAAKMGSVQGRMIMGFFYFVIVTPFGLGLRLLSDPLTIRTTPQQTGWSEKEPFDSTIEAAQEQG